MVSICSVASDYQRFDLVLNLFAEILLVIGCTPSGCCSLDVRLRLM